MRLWKTPESGAYELLPTLEDPPLPQCDAPQQNGSPRLSLPISQMRIEYDVVIIGSGYGSGVAASRMARAGKSVAVLELGKEKWPGEFPTTFTEAVREFRTSGFQGTGERGQRAGLFHLVAGEGQDVFVGHGLGGTSLINANVFLRADKKTLQLPAWPKEIRENPRCLDKYYARAAEMLQPNAYPLACHTPNKLKVFEQQAAALSQSRNFYRVPLTTSFQDRFNHAGVRLNASTSAGQESTGVNDGSKNSVLVTYLADAWNWGAEMFCECDVRYVKENEKQGGYAVFFSWLGGGGQAFREMKEESLMWVRARELCILGAGTLGSTEILLRSREAGLPTSTMVGEKFSGNGDILGFAYNSDEIINGIGRESANTSILPGPTITSVIDMRNPETETNTLNGYMIQEGNIPAALAPAMQTMLEATPRKKHSKSFRRGAVQRFCSAMKTRVLGPYANGGSLARTQTYLVMSHDSSEGTMRLKDDKLKLSFVGTGRSERVARIRSVLEEASKSIGGTFIDAPLSVGRMRNQLTVHPLGGAIMSSGGTGRTGVVDHLGRLFKGEGNDIHQGILCVDASVIPTSLAVNPLATITALAERACDLLLRQNEWTADDTQNGVLDVFGNPKIIRPPSLGRDTSIDQLKNGDRVQFTEVMDGHINIVSNARDFGVANRIARGASSSACLCITVEVSEMKRSSLNSDVVGYATGTFSCAALSPFPLMVQDGQIHFFTVDDQVSEATKMLYKLTLQDITGEVFCLDGHKVIDSNMAFSFQGSWKATTTLYTSIMRADRTPLGKGILRISLGNLMKQLRTFQGLPRPTLEFLTFFARNTARYFISPFRSLQYPDPGSSGYFPKQDPAVVTSLEASDGVKTPMRVWYPVANLPKRPLAILFIPGASVDHQVFALPTIKTNTIDYFTGLGYVCYVSTLRFGMLPVAQQGHTAYDARLDVKSAMEYVREQEGERKFYVVCHCLGSIATGMALLTGVVKAEWLAGMTCSQVFTDLRFGTVNRLKAGNGGLVKAYTKLAGHWFPSDTTASSARFQRIIDQLLRLYPIGERCEFCSSTVCHRCSLVFGRLWTHSKLNHATHLHLTNFFSGIHMSFLAHLTGMGSTAPYHVRSNKPAFKDLVTEPGNLQRLEGLRIHFVSGGANVVFEPWSTERTYEMLRERFGTEMYSRVVLDDYGHLDTWMGRDSVVDVYPRVWAHVEFCEEVM